MQVSEVAVEFFQTAIAAPDALAFMKAAPHVVEALLKAGVSFSGPREYIGDLTWHPSHLGDQEQPAALPSFLEAAERSMPAAV